MESATALLQVNGCSSTSPCSTWQKLADQHNIDTIWWDEWTVNQRSIDIAIIQCAVQWYDLRQFNFGNAKIFASCGDAAVVTNLNAVFNNLPLLTRLNVEGYDYFDEYGNGPDRHKLHFMKLCADNHFPYLQADKEHDWIFAGQVYPQYDERLKKFRNQLIPRLLEAYPNGLLIGHGWSDFIGCGLPAVSQSQLNPLYAKSRVVVSIDAHDGVGYTSTRTIEAMHGGHCALIYNHDGMHYLKQFVVDGEHALYFKTVEEFGERLRFVKDNPDKAIEIGKNGHKLVIEKGWSMSGWYKSILESLQI